MRSLLAACLVFAACGAPEPEIVAQKPLSGDHTANFYLRSSEGSCEFVPESGSGTLAFTPEGQLKSPFPGVDCTVTYEPGAVDFTCTGYDSRVTAHGFRLGTTVYGSGEFKGNVGGCTAVRFQFDLNPSK